MGMITQISPTSLIPILVGVHYQTCPVFVREALARWMQNENAHPIFQSLLQECFPHSPKPECVVISTCNRFECFLYIHEADRDNVQTLLPKMAQRCEVTLDISHTHHFVEDKAVLRLFKIAAGLDSMVLGEPHILAQMKDAVVKAKQQGLCTNKLMRIFDRAFYVAKRVRHETEVGRHSLSMSTAALSMAQKVFDSLADKQILIVGAGEMAKLGAQNLKELGAHHITIANRNLENAQKLAQQLNLSVQVIDLNSLPESCRKFDLIYCAVAVSQPLLEKNYFTQSSPRKSMQVIVDLGVPRNVHENVADLEGVFLFDVDDFEKVTHEHRRARSEAAVLATDIVQQEVLRFMHEDKQNSHLSHLSHFHEWFVSTLEGELQRALKKQDWEDVDRAKVVARSVAKKMLANPMEYAKSHPQEMTSENMAELYQRLLPRLEKIRETELS